MTFSCETNSAGPDSPPRPVGGGRGRPGRGGSPGRFWMGDGGRGCALPARGGAPGRSWMGGGGRGGGGRGGGRHPRVGFPGRFMVFAHRFDEHDKIKHGTDVSPAHAKLARLQQRAIRLQRQVNQERGQNHPNKRHQQPITIPHEVHEDSETFRLRLVIPGYSPSSLTVTVGPFGHFLRIHGKKNSGIATNTEGAKDNHFQVAFKVNGKFDTQKLPHSAKAILSNGILHVSVPKDSTYGQATPVAVSEAVTVPTLPVTAPADATELLDDDFVDVQETAMMTTKTPTSTKDTNLQAMTSSTTTDREECADGTEDCVDEEMEDEDDSEDDVENEDKPHGGENKAMFRRLVEVPGVRLEDVTVEHECEGRILRVTAVRRAGLTGYQNDKTFQQTFRLRPIARGIDIANLAATLDHGVLSITAPRTMTPGLDGKSKGGKMQQDERPKRFVIPVTIGDGMLEEEDDTGFESMDLTKLEKSTEINSA